MERRCYADHCRNTVRRGHVFCSACWRLVPRRERTRIWRAWESVEARTTGVSQRPWKEIAQEWLAAIREARAAVAEVLNG